jgi:polyisoprenoid-binding protein YceI
MKKHTSFSMLRGIQTHAASLAAIAFVAAVAVIAPALPRPQQPATRALELNFDPAKTQIRWTLDTTLHTVHGTFQLKRGALRFDPSSGAVTGEIVADAASGQSGSSGRDAKMHKDVLESAKFAEVTFRPDRAEGGLAASGASTLKVHGIFVLHGTEHEITLPVQITRDGDHWTSNSSFSIPFLAWGLKNPSNFLLKVKPDVQIELDGAGAVH